MRARQLTAALLALLALPADAFDRFEIQVYQGDLQEPGHLPDDARAGAGRHPLARTRDLAVGGGLTCVADQQLIVKTLIGRGF